MTKRRFTMCYEYWHDRQARAAEEEAKKRAADIIEKARAGELAPPPSQPATAGQDDETVPA
jgi:hypothetical protein